MEEEINKIENKIEKQQKRLEQSSLALELLKDYKKSTKRLFIIILVILCMWFITIGYLIYILNDTTDYKSIDIDNVSQIDNSSIKNGDDLWVE